MQTFLPYPSFSESAQCLDRLRLGKQRVEAMQIISVLEGRSTGWANHPAVRMWRGHVYQLKVYYNTMCREWMLRGYNQTMPLFDVDLAIYIGITIPPPWLSDPAFHLSHKSNLIRKLPTHYGPMWPDVPNNLPYVWPV